MGYLKSLGDKRYRIVYDVQPTEGRKRQQKTETLSNVTKKQAEAILAKREEAVANGTYVREDDMILSELFERFMTKKRSRIEATTFARYKTLFDNHLVPAFGNMKVKELRQGHLVNTYAEWLENGSNGRRISAKTIRHAHEVLRNALNWAVRMEYVTRNVATLVSSDDLPKAPAPKPKALNEAELTRLLSEAKNPTRLAAKRGYLSSQPWFYPAIFFAAYTGCRRGEILALRWSDVDFEEKVVTIARSVTETLEFKRPKNDKIRTLTMPDALASVLRSHKAVQAKERLALGPAYRDQDLVFAHADGSPVRPWNFGEAARDLARRAGCSITLHGLRDTHASLLAKAGVPLEVISKRLGHSNIIVTADRYLDVYKDRDAQAASAFEGLVG